MIRMLGNEKKGNLDMLDLSKIVSDKFNILITTNLNYSTIKTIIVDYVETKFNLDLKQILEVEDCIDFEIKEIEFSFRRFEGK